MKHTVLWQSLQAWHKRLAFGLIAGAALSATGCASDVSTLNTTTLMPAKKEALPKGSAIAVVPFNERFSGDWSRQGWTVAEAEVTRILTNAAVEGESYFRIVDRELIENVFDEQALTARGGVTEAAASDVGRTLGADYVVFGTTDYNYSSRWYDATFNVCVPTVGDECVRKDIPVDCQSVTIQTSLFPKIVSVTDGQVRYAERIDRSSEIDGCSGRGFNPIRNRRAYAQVNEEVVGKRLISASIEEFRTHVAPYKGRVSLHFALKHELQDEASIERFEFAKELHSSDVKAACNIWKTLDAELSPAARGPDTALKLNRGVCLEYEGDFAGAKQVYQNLKASLIEQGIVPAGMITDALRRVDDRMAKENQLSQELGT